MAPDSSPRAGHESLDVASRRRKAEKIRAILAPELDVGGAAVLEVGVGSGVIAASFADVVGPTGEVWGTDVRDSRVVEGFRFVQTEGTSLPFADCSFDIVISNHVVEHVGDREDQLHHLRAIARVLRDGGVAYLATPNRWTVLEPHFHLPLLSWLPRGLRTPYVRLARRGDRYDCDPLSRPELLEICASAGLEAADRTLDAVGLTAAIESVPTPVRLLAAAPRAVHRALLPVIPTHILILRKDGRESRGRPPGSGAGP
jgi:SAM-dependent methyltransferase